MPVRKLKKRPLTRKQKAFADHLINNPKDSAAQAAREVYDIHTNGSSARTIAAQTLALPSVQTYLDAHIDKAKNRVVELIDSEKEDIALRASDSVLDRALGKATQRIQTQSTAVTLNLSLSDLVNSGSTDTTQ